MKRSHYAGLVFLFIIALFLGGASVWPIDSLDDAARGLTNVLILFTAELIFLFILPRRLNLPSQIFVAMVAGVFVGWLMQHLGRQELVSDYINVFGRVFILLLRVAITPLIFVSIICGVAGIGDVRKLGPLGAKTIIYYLSTTAIAVVIGLITVNLIQPGTGREALRAQAVFQDTSADVASLESRIRFASLMELARKPLSSETNPLISIYEVVQPRPEPQKTLGQRIQHDILPSFIKNPIMAGQDTLVIIFFALLLGAALAALGDENGSALGFFRTMDRALIQIVMWVMLLAPIGVFALMADAISHLGLHYIVTLAKYCVTVLLGLGVHFIILVFVVIPLLGRISPVRFLRGMTQAFQVAFSTSSSSATLPISIECVTKKVGADSNISSFMLPIGATVNMDGTALYTAVASLFIAQVYGLDLTLQAQILVFLTAVIVSVGTAGIPSASIGLMSIILHAAGIPIEGIGIVVGVDRFLDMCRTVINITGDSVGAVVVSRSEGLMSSHTQR